MISQNAVLDYKFSVRWLPPTSTDLMEAAPAVKTGAQLLTFPWLSSLLAGLGADECPISYALYCIPNQMSFQRPPDAAPAECVQYYRKVYELSQQSDVGNIGDPQLIYARKSHLSGKVRIYRQ